MAADGELEAHLAANGQTYGTGPQLAFEQIYLGETPAPDGATLEYTDAYTREIEKFFAEVPEIRSYFMVVAPGLEKPNPVNTALSFVRLTNWDERTRSQVEVSGSVAPKMCPMSATSALS